MSKKVLEGIRVLEWGMLQQGPVASAILADLGAEVIKIESRQGDNSRYIKVFYKQDSELPDGSTTYFESCNRNKKGITLDLKTPEGKDLLYKLVEKSDVFLTNFRPGVPERLGAGYEDLKKVNPKIIYAYATGLGLHGPDKDAALIDFIAMARSGIMYSVGNVGDDPGFIQGAFCDQMGGMMTAFGVVSALMARERHGIGQLVEINLLTAFSNLNWVNVNQYAWTHTTVERNDRANPSSPLSNYYKCKDGEWIMLGAYLAKSMKNFFTIIDMPEIANNPKYTDNAGILEDSEMLTKIVQDVMLTKDRDEWVEILKANDFIVGPVNTYADLFKDPQMFENHGFYFIKHPSREEPVQLVGAPFHLVETPCSIEKWAPKLGEDNKEIYSNLCGLNEDQLVELKNKGVI
jgi:crotonobetainyl-CoA:carnitine CoA-transferase CaiB-like acyl-CoA transferase